MNITSIQMVEKQLLIVGIDPGTTAGYAAIDFEGKVVKTHSEKNLDLNTLISELVKLGRPLIIASDKEYNPDFVEKAAIKLGARLISPDYDLKVIEKREIARNHATNNQHEIDALASALFVLKKINPLLNKINIFVEHYGKEDIKQQLIEFVVGKELSIRDSVDIIETPEQEETKIIKEVVEEKKLTEKDFLILYKKFRDVKRDAFFLKRQNDKLKNQIAFLKKDYEMMFRKISKTERDKKMQSLLEFKENRIKGFDNTLKNKNDEVKLMQNEITTLLYFLSNMNSCILLKKLDNLGLNEFDRKKNILNINEGDTLLVKDPDIISEKTIEEIKSKISIVLYKKPISKKIESRLPFIFINANDLTIEENDYFATVNKNEFESLKNKKNLLTRVVENYKKERNQ